MKKLLVIKLSALGDLAQVEPFLPSLAKQYSVTFLTSPLGYAYYQDCGYIDDFIILENKKISSLLKIIPKYFNQYDYVLDLQGNDRSSVLSFFAFKPVYSYHSKYYHYENLTEFDKAFIREKSVLHEVTFSTIKQLPSVEIAFQPFIPHQGQHIVLNMGASPGWESKRLPAECWNQISAFLTDKFNLPFLLTGSAEEKEYISTVAKDLTGNYENVAGKTSLPELKDILKNAALTVSTDSGPMQISAVQQTPTIGLFGATNWVRSAPYGNWSETVYSKDVYPDGRPPAKSLKSVGAYYKNIDIAQAISSLEPFIAS